MKKANSFAKKGKLEEAIQLYSIVLQKFPENRLAKDGLIKINNSMVIDYKKELLCLYDEKKYDIVIKKTQLLTNKLQHSIFLWNILGHAFFSQKKFEDAIESFEQLLKIKPDFAEAYNNIGLALSKNGYFKKAVEKYERAIQIKPSYSDAYNNMGISLSKIRDFEKAIRSFKKALDIQPNSNEILFNIGNVLDKVTINKKSQEISNIFCSILDKKNYIRPSSIVKKSIDIIKFEPSFKNLFEKHNSGDLRNSIHEVIMDLSEISLLLKLMRVCPLIDLEIEKLLTKLRRTFLLSITDRIFPPESLEFLSTLALQCFTNEYIYTQDVEETKVLKELEILTTKMFLNNEQPLPQIILCLATYKSLHEYEWFNSLTNNTIIEDVFRRQVLEPIKEVQLKSHIPILGKITDKISSRVREQYEKNPYPRWVNLSLSINTVSVSQLIMELQLKIFNPLINEIKKPHILIAGCGTGQQVIEKASYLENSKFLAIDLSLSSLAYAKRKTKELGINNIEYAQSDILNLDKLETHFDIIECVGVLHHMDNPMAGWKILVDRLKPGGLMKIGLYSEIARKSIVSIRKKISSLGIQSNDIAMKLFRQEIIASSYREFKDVMFVHDFYSLSMLRDLLFHVQEYRFTITQIENHLSELNLKFCGFEGKDLIDDFKKTNNGENDIYDLKKWKFFEEKNPSKFISMYQFWCQKT
tara:strand:+ start:133 stop:2226 length:2094 start_codon:yes stop_codon:yes gene_type:complete